MCLEIIIQILHFFVNIIIDRILFSEILGVRAFKNEQDHLFIDQAFNTEITGTFLLASFLLFY